MRTTDFSRWTEVDNEVFKELPYQVAEWVAEFGSLTEKLATHVDQVKIDLLKQQAATLTAEEATCLQTNQQQQLVREVILYGPEKPWIFARTILNKQAEHLIAELGNQPLGSILFSGTHLRRHQLQLKKLDKNDPLYQSARESCSELTANLWARRSLWVSSREQSDIKILVSEVFLPNSPLYK